MVAEALAVGFVDGQATYVTYVDMRAEMGAAHIKREGVNTPVDPRVVIWFLKIGDEKRPTCIERLDGARVMIAESYDARRDRAAGRPVTTAKDWIAFAPGSTSALRTRPMGKCSRGKGGGGYRAAGYRRRWRTYEAAIKAVDREFPYAPGA